MRDMQMHTTSAHADLNRVPPHSIEAEQAVLGGLMLDPHALDRISHALNEADFYRRDHKLIFRGIGQLADQNKPYDAITLGDWFDGLGATHIHGLSSYLIELANLTPSAANILAYAQIVRDRSIKRQLIDVSTTITDESLDPAGPNSQQLLESAEQRVFRISETASASRQNMVTVNVAVRDAFKVLTERFNNQGQLIGVPTGFVELDKLTAGLQPSDLIIVAARPSIGKTAFALNIAEHAAIRAGTGVLIFSMEMSHAQLAFRLISSVARVDQQHLRTGDVPEEDWPRISNAIALLSGSTRMFIDDTPALSPVELRSRARRVYREHKIGLIVIDYLQLMHVPGSNENRATEIAEISRSLKALAKELNVPVMALSQLNRSLEQRADKRPMMSDLRESGAIEQDADLIIFIYRDEYYNKESEAKGKAEIIIGKQRNGPTDTTVLDFIGRYTKFQSPGDVTFNATI